MCNLSDGRRLAHLAEGSFDAVAVTAAPEGALAAWSSPAGSFARRLDHEGQARGAAVRVAERCEGGLALASAREGFWLACLQPERDARLVALSPALEVDETRSLGPAGRDSEGIDVVAHAGRAHVVYQDGTPGAYAIYLVSTDADSLTERRRLSDPAYAATAPSLTLADGKWVASWAETRFSTAHSTLTRVALQREGEPVRTLGETPLNRPDARLVWGAHGPWLGFRGRRPKDRHPQLYVTALTDDLQPRGEARPVRVGRANTLAAPLVQECGGQRFAHMSRLYGGERYVALYPLDTQLRSLGGGYQYYENGHDYERIAAACGEHGPLLVAAERPHGPDTGARLTAALLRCPDAVEPHGCSFPCTSR